MPEFRTETGSIYYRVFAPKAPVAQAVPTITLLHNFMSSGEAAWGMMVPALAEHYRVLVPDLPGHGRSLGHPADYAYWAMAQQIAALIEAEGATQGHLAGCSAGGMIAQLLVHHQLVQPRSLTLISTTYSLNPATTGNQATLTPEQFKASPRWMEATAKLHDPYHYPGYYQQELLPGFRHLTIEQSIDLPISALSTWQFPVCLIQGEQDEFFPAFIVERMARAIPDVELHLIPDQTHALLFRQPWKVREIMLAFLHRR